MIELKIEDGKVVKSDISGDFLTVAGESQAITAGCLMALLETMAKGSMDTAKLMLLRLPAYWNNTILEFKGDELNGTLPEVE